MNTNKQTLVCTNWKCGERQVVALQPPQRLSEALTCQELHVCQGGCRSVTVGIPPQVSAPNSPSAAICGSFICAAVLRVFPLTAADTPSGVIPINPEVTKLVGLVASQRA